MLTGWLQIGSEAENFIYRSNPPGQVTAHDAGDILANAQAGQTILSELRAGETMAGLLIHLPRPDQHLVGDGECGERQPPVSGDRTGTHRTPDSYQPDA